MARETFAKVPVRTNIHSFFLCRFHIGTSALHHYIYHIFINVSNFLKTARGVPSLRDINEQQISKVRAGKS
jgi:hypothetical protein